MNHSRLSFARILLAAAVMHLALCTFTYLVGRFQLFPDMFDTAGVGRFVPDGESYRIEIFRLMETLKGQGIAEWFAATPPLHIKLYSLCFVAFSPLLGNTILSAEPLNLLYYLVILSLVFKLGEGAFNARVGVFSSSIIALWPSFLLHSVQILRDPLFIAAVLALILVELHWLIRNLSWRGGLVNAAVGGLICLTLWFARSSMWELVLAIVILGVGFLAVRQLSERRIVAGNLLGATLLLMIAIMIPKLVSFYSRPNYSPVDRAREAQAEAHPAPAIARVESQREVLLSRLPRRIALARKEFLRQYVEPGSNIDADVQFFAFADMVRYIPRAVVIGFFAPFPSMWLAAGKQVGLAGRVLSGVETLVMLINYIFVALGLWRGRRRLPTWLLLAIAAVGVTALAMVVINVGALYRMRYVFWMLLIILGVGGASQVIPGAAPKEVCNGGDSPGPVEQITLT